jgi:putative SOS response-associated peptidase YedK
MCGRFTLANPAAVSNAMPWLRDVPPATPRYNIAPGQQTWLISMDNNASPNTAFGRMARWGFQKRWSSSNRDLLINARSEKVLDTPTFSESFKQRRCVIPADGFYEWRNIRTDSEPFLFQRLSAELFCLAGIYEQSGDQWNFVILTTAANALVKRIHPRMPVMLTPADARDYLTTAANTPGMKHFLQGFPDRAMMSHRVSALVNRVEHDSIACMQPFEAPPERQQEMF